MIERAKKNHLHLIVDLCNEVQWVHATYTSLESWTDFSTRTLDHISAREKFKGFAISNGGEQSKTRSIAFAAKKFDISNSWISYYMIVYNVVIGNFYLYLIPKDDFK